MTELKLVRGTRLRWGLGTWICRRHRRWFKCWTRGCYCRQRRPAFDLEDDVEVGFVNGTEDGVVDWFVDGYVECGWRRSGSDEGKLHGYMEGSIDGSNVWIQGWHWRQFSILVSKMVLRQVLLMVLKMYLWRGPLSDIQHHESVMNKL